MMSWVYLPNGTTFLGCLAQSSLDAGCGHPSREPSNDIVVPQDEVRENHTRGPADQRDSPTQNRSPPRLGNPGGVRPSHGNAPNPEKVQPLTCAKEALHLFVSPELDEERSKVGVEDIGNTTEKDASQDVHVGAERERPRGKHCGVKPAPRPYHSSTEKI